MKFKYLFIVIAASLFFACNNSYENASLETYNDTLSYSIGKDLAKNFEKNELDSIISIDLLAKGMFDYYNNDSALMTEKDVQDFLGDYMMKKRKEEQEKRLAENKIKFKDVLESGENYLKENAEKEGVQITESGLQYRIIKEGKGKKPHQTDRVKVHYEGKLVDGTVFDSSYEKDKPSEFAVMQVIKGWSEGLLLMSEGSTFEFVIPYELAYGERGKGQIKPFSTLIFKVELIEVIHPNAVK